MKYAILMSVVGTVALGAGCSDDPKTPATGGSGGADASSSSSSSSSGMGGTGGMGTGGMGTGGMSTGGAGGSGGTMVCDNGAVVDKVDPTMRCKSALPAEVVNIVMAPPTMKWADKIVDFSSEFGAVMYGSTQVKGAPNVYPASGDEPNAWAQATEDMANEFINVGFTTPVVADSVWVFETFNPGAISKITVTAADGPHIVYENMNPQSIGACGHVLSVSTKTCSPISAVRIDVASDKVSTFNEIDAVGLLPHQ